MNSMNAWVDPRIALVRAEDVKAYLLRRKWELTPRSDENMLVFFGPMDDSGLNPISFVMPASEKFSDFRPHMERLIGALGQIENRYAVDVLNDILAENPALLNGVANKKATKRPRAKQQAKVR